MIVNLLKKFLFVVIPRYPFVSCITFLMFIAERASKKPDPPFDLMAIYVSIALFFACGVLMSFKKVDQYSAQFMSLLLLISSAVFYTNTSLGYRDWVKIRVATRMIGCSGFFIFFSHFSCNSNHNILSRQIKRIGDVIIGTYFLLTAWTILNSPEDKSTFLKFNPGGQFTLFTYALVMSAAGCCYIPNWFSYDMTFLATPLIVFSTINVDTQFDYWTTHRNIDFWMQVRLLTDNIMIVLGMLLYIVCHEKVMHKEKGIKSVN